MLHLLAGTISHHVFWQALTTSHFLVRTNHVSFFGIHALITSRFFVELLTSRFLAGTNYVTNFSSIKSGRQSQQFSKTRNLVIDFTY